MTDDALTLFDARPTCERCGQKADGPWWEARTSSSAFATTDDDTTIRVCAVCARHYRTARQLAP